MPRRAFRLPPGAAPALGGGRLPPPSRPPGAVERSIATRLRPRQLVGPRSVSTLLPLARQPAFWRPPMCCRTTPRKAPASARTPSPVRGAPVPARVRTPGVALLRWRPPGRTPSLTAVRLVVLVPALRCATLA
eukprot:6849889-Alexandrium_andersonii.AAC.1